MVSSNPQTGDSPVLSFTLNSIPAASFSSSVVTLKLYDGTDATQSSRRKNNETSITINWSSDGEKGISPSLRKH